MNLFLAWRDSLTIFQPKNFKLFFLVTLKTMVDTFKVWIKYFWWLPLIELVMPRVWLHLYGTTSFFQNIWLHIAATNVMGMLWFVSILLAARPSVALKNCAYFRSYIWRIIYILPINFAIFWGIESLVVPVFSRYINMLLTSTFTPASIAAMLMLGLIHWSARIYIINYSLFVLDTDGSIKQVCKSILYALKMVLYNYPFYIVVYIVHALIKMGQHVLFRPLTVWFCRFCSATTELGPISLYGIHYSNMLVIALLTFLLYCLLTNFYIKKLHDQFTLYFGKNE